MNLKSAYEPYFKIGVALSQKNLDLQTDRALTVEQFNSITCENHMKPMFLLDWEKNLKNPQLYQTNPAVSLAPAKPFLDFAKEHHIPMRGHTLVWHNQTPLWFFHENYDEKAPFADRETLLLRLENYIKNVFELIHNEYLGLFYAFDVVNEIVDEGDFRKSKWLELVGEDFFVKAFEYARKYADSEIKLFYNDYNSFEPWKRDFICERVLKPLIERNLVDGMGMQSHLIMEEPELELFRTAVKTYGALGITVHLTELDIHNNDPSEESMNVLADRYAGLFRILIEEVKNQNANIECVTFWNLNDEDSWLTGFRRETSYPLLFTNGKPKKAYDAVIKVACAD